ncbi:hypothetical protein OFS07_06475 [Brachyspira hyodysenteriae]|nr:hypothetical protein [Brachyspira hyodysenteriae]MDA0071009.1 hypothetical protein [Brachyspira hyodysenteriae]MDA0088884.1 hypothetical protein [Brachyspira hyodysenteriae]
MYEKYISNNSNIESDIYEKLSSLYSQVFRYDNAIETYNKLLEINGKMKLIIVHLESFITQ